MEKEWSEYERRRPASPIYRASVDHDGSFRIDDMPAGDYTLTVRFTGGNNSPRNVAGSVEYEFTVPSIWDGRSTDVLDLGTITLPKRQHCAGLES